MSDAVVTLNVPARPQFARSVRMMAANLAVLCSMNVDEVEDARMAAEEAFVYACATEPDICAITFEIRGSVLEMTFTLGESSIEEGTVAEQVSMAELLLSCVCDAYEVAPDGSELLVTKRSGDEHAG